MISALFYMGLIFLASKSASV